MAEQQQYVSLNPDTYTQGGLIDNVDIEITAAKWVRWDYQGTRDEDVPALLLTMQPLDGGNASDQALTAGDIKDWVPSEDGEHLVPASKDSPSGLRNNTNTSIFFAELVKLGFPKNRLSCPASELVGLQCHVVRKKVEGKGGGTGASDKEKYVPTVLLRLPWEKQKGASARKPTTATTSAAVPATTPAASAAVDPGSIPDNIREAVTVAVAEAVNGTESMAFLDFKKKVFTLIAPKLKVPERTSGIKLLDSEDFLVGCGVFREGDTVSVMPA